VGSTARLDDTTLYIAPTNVACDSWERLKLRDRRHVRLMSSISAVVCLTTYIQNMFTLNKII